MATTARTKGNGVCSMCLDCFGGNLSPLGFPGGKRLCGSELLVPTARNSRLLKVHNVARSRGQGVLCKKKIQALQIFRHAHPHARASSSDWILQNVHLTENNEVGHCNMELLRVLPTDVVVHGVLLQNTVHTTARTSWNVKGRVTPITNVTKFPQNCTNLLQYRKIFTRTLFLKV